MIALAGLYAGSVCYFLQRDRAIECEAPIDRLLVTQGGESLAFSGKLRLDLPDSTMMLSLTREGQGKLIRSLQVQPEYDWLGRMDALLIRSLHYGYTDLPWLSADKRLHLLAAGDRLRFAAVPVGQHLWLLQVNDVRLFCLKPGTDADRHN
ncbi:MULTISPECIES: hypothetical protein [unclassified Paludibacterium]|uniref:hypothetical protein n=1 Tax=unclassified Paludibacterium TaxID=2618429 RepID=UPI001C059988|nr:hypothetical protein [Paludibacterium sp. B53371]BEV71089.1 hypothetical protein THUN1379_05710 [Paludibacterium sp. THUN1379]